MNQITAPFTPAQVDQLNQYQTGIDSIHSGHPFTCSNRSDGMVFLDGKDDDSKAAHGKEGGDRGILIATEAGWVCPYCGHTQDWAFDSMARPTPVESEANVRSILATQGLDAKQLLIDRADDVITAYDELYRITEIRNPSDPILGVIAGMLASLRRRHMQLLGVTIVDGQIANVDDSWNHMETKPPANSVPVHALVQDLEAKHPLHDGYGCGGWIETCVFGLPEFYLSKGGVVTHWKPI